MEHCLQIDRQVAEVKQAVRFQVHEKIDVAVRIVVACHGAEYPDVARPAPSRNKEGSRRALCSGVPARSRHLHSLSKSAASHELPQDLLANYVPFLAQSELLDRSKKLPAFFYESALGNSPVREWVMGLCLEDRKRVGRDIQKVEFGWPLGMPYCRSLGNGLWEVRSDLTDGKIGRVILRRAGTHGAAAQFRQENAEGPRPGFETCAQADEGGARR